MLSNHLLMNKSWKPLQLLRMANHLDRINLALSSFQSHPEVTAAILLPLFDKVWHDDEIPGDWRKGSVDIFGFRNLKLRSSGFGVLPGLRVFFNLVFGFRRLLTMMAVFRIFLFNAFYGFSGFAKEITCCSRAKIVIQDITYIAFHPFF